MDAAMIFSKKEPALYYGADRNSAYKFTLKPLQTIFIDRQRKFKVAG
jgi:hypothetical protein